MLFTERDIILFKRKIRRLSEKFIKIIFIVMNKLQNTENKKNLQTTSFIERNISLAATFFALSFLPYETFLLIVICLKRQRKRSRTKTETKSWFLVENRVFKRYIYVYIRAAKFSLSLSLLFPRNSDTK